MSRTHDWERRSSKSSDISDNSEVSRSGRSPARRDHDRVFYSAEFERLEEVTQIATLTSSSVRNRLTHSYRVEQIAQSIASRLPSEDIDVDVVATAALVHDMGHAPFGHTGEEALQRAVTCSIHRKSRRPNTADRQRDISDMESDEFSPDRCDKNQPCILMDGFEGNAQSFRILTLLGSNHPTTKEHGLDLTRRVLHASLKYPWLAREDPDKLHKWGVYDLDMDAFMWVLGASDVSEVCGKRQQNLEASVMDLADDIAYAVHDLEDAYKLGLIPASELQNMRSSTFSKVIAYIRGESTPGPSQVGDGDEEEAPGPLYDTPISKIVKEWEIFVESEHDPEFVNDDGTRRYPHLHQLQACLNRIASARYSGGLQSRNDLSAWRAYLISEFVNDVEVNNGHAEFASPFIASSIEFLKQVTWYFVIDDPDLSAIREGQERLVIACFENLFALSSAAYLQDADGKHSAWRTQPLHRSSKRLPERLNDYVLLTRMQLEAAPEPRCSPRQAVARAVVDYICSLTDDEVYSYSLQLDGAPSHSVPGIYRR